MAGEIIIVLNRAQPGELTALWMAGQKGYLTEAEWQRFAEFVAAVVVAWPYEQPITAEGYFNLSLPDSKAVDAAISEAAQTLRGPN